MKLLPFSWVAILLLVPTIRAEETPVYSDRARLLVWRDNAGKDHPIRTASDWAKRRAHILANMVKVMGPLPDASRKVPLDIKVEEEIQGEGFIRKKLTYATEKGDRVPAYLFLPTGKAGKRPAVLCLHPTHLELGKGIAAGLGPKKDRGYALELAQRGYVTLAPDYPKMGGYDPDIEALGYVSTTMKGIWNHMRGVDLLQSLPEVDPAHIGVIGHSLGGHNSLFVAAFDERIQCAVTNCGFCDFGHYYKGNIKGWASKYYMPRINTVYELKPEKMPFDFPEVLAAIAPRAVLASAPIKDHNFDVEGVKFCVASAKPVFELLGVPDKLAANYPDCDHNFPDDVRKVANEFLDRWLKK